MQMNRVKQAAHSEEDSMDNRDSVASRAFMISSDSKEGRTHSEMCLSSSSNSSEEVQTDRGSQLKQPKAKTLL